MARYTQQEKLAMMRTGYESVREMARDLGISHQKLGRWLREGQDGGIKRILDDLFTREAINLAFVEHKNRVYLDQRARGVPPIQNAPPVWFERRKLDIEGPNGEPIYGDRIVVNHTEFIRGDLRQEVIRRATESQQFFGVSIRSIVDMRKYVARYIDQEIESGKRSGRRRNAAIEAVTAQFMRSSVSEIRQIAQIKPIYTLTQDITPGADVDMVVSGVEAKLQNKHSTASLGSKTAFADSFWFQLLPTDWDGPIVKQTSGRKYIRGRGNK